MIPRDRPVKLPTEELPAVELEEIQVTDVDFWLLGGVQVWRTVLPEDTVEEGEQTIVIQAGGIETVIQRDKVLYRETRTRTVKRPKAPV